jgi:hypothetical protein
MWLVDDEVVTRWGMSIFIIFISSIWFPWLMTKWHGRSIVITTIKKWLQVIWYEHRQPYTTPHLFMYHLKLYPPTHLSTYLLSYPPNHLPITYPPTHLFTYLFAYLPNYLPLKCQSTHTWPTYLLAYLASHPPTHPITCLPTHSPTYLITLLTYLPTYLPPTYHLTTCNLSHDLVMIWNKHVK